MKALDQHYFGMKQGESYIWTKGLVQHIQTLTCSRNSASNFEKKKSAVHESENQEPRSYLLTPFYSICSLTNGTPGTG